MTGPEFDKLSDDEVDQLEELPRVIARCVSAKGMIFDSCL